MNNIDKRNKLAALPFSFKITNNEKVIIHYENKQIMFIKGKQAAKFQSNILHISEREIQLILAKITGNFKRGNERSK